MTDKWDLIDKTDGKMKGYLEIRCNGNRIADAFPCPGHADQEYSVRIRQKAQEIVDTMNGDQ